MCFENSIRLSTRMIKSNGTAGHMKISTSRSISSKYSINAADRHSPAARIWFMVEPLDCMSLACLKHDTWHPQYNKVQQQPTLFANHVCGICPHHGHLLVTTTVLMPYSQHQQIPERVESHMHVSASTHLIAP